MFWQLMSKLEEEAVDQGRGETINHTKIPTCHCPFLREEMSPTKTEDWLMITLPPKSSQIEYLKFDSLGA